MAVTVSLTCMMLLELCSSVHVWGAHGDVSFLRSSPGCHFNSSAVQGAGFFLFSPPLVWNGCASSSSSSSSGLNELHIRDGGRRCFPRNLKTRSRNGFWIRSAAFLRYPPVRETAGPWERRLRLDGIGSDAWQHSARMIKNSGEGNGQDGSCVRSDKADVLALAGGNSLSVVCTSQDCGCGRLWGNVVRIPLTLFNT